MTFNQVIKLALEQAMEDYDAIEKRARGRSSVGKHKQAKKRGVQPSPGHRHRAGESGKVPPEDVQ